jgi:hypothetical protein
MFFLSIRDVLLTLLSLNVYLLYIIPRASNNIFLLQNKGIRITASAQKRESRKNII